MTGMPYNLQGKKGVFQLADISSFSSLAVDKWKNKKELEREQEQEEEEEEEESDYSNYNCFVNEPTSVLDTQKSPSPPTSTSTLSSSLGGSSGCGGGTTGSTDTAGVAAVSDNPPSSHTKWQQRDTTSPDPAGTTTTTTTVSPTELQSIPTTLDIISGSGGGGAAGGGGGGAEKCVGGGGMEDWESMWPETAASPSQEQSLLRWIMGDVEDPSSGLKHFLQGVGSSAPDQFELNNNAGSGFGFVDSGGSVGGVLEALSCSSVAGGSALLNPSFTGGNSPAAATSSLPFPTTNLPNNGRFVVSNSIPNPVSSSSSLPNHAKIAPFSSTSASASVTTNPSNPPIFSPSSNNLPLNIPLPISLYQQQQQQQQFELAEEKPQLLNPNLSVPQILINHQQNQPTQNPAFFVPLSSPSYPLHHDQHLLPPQPKRHHPAAIVDPSFQISKQLPFSDSAHQELYLRRNQNIQQFQHQTQQGFPQQLQLLPNHLLPRPMMSPASAATKAKIISPGGGGEDPLAQNQQHLQHQQQQHALIDQLLKAAELVEIGNSVLARGILARLNHQLSPIGKPLHRAAFYFKEALLHLTNNNAATTTISPPQRISTPFDVFLKIGSYKAFSEISPIVQFANFTCNQVLLEALEGFNSIRIIDFDLGLGCQWASFMQEISLRMGGAPSLKITAITSPSSHDHPLELVLAKGNLSHFASDLGVSFVIEILNLDSYDPASWSLALNVSEGEAVAVNLPASSSTYHSSSFPSLLRLVKQLSPKIVVSVERGCDRSDLPVLQHFLHSLTSYSVLLESLDAASTKEDTVNKIERFLLQPRIDSTVIRRHCMPDKVPPCRTLFSSAAFSPFPFSNFTETQAEWLVKRLRVRGFHVEKRQNSLFLCWHTPQQDLVSVSAWTC